VRFIEEFEGDVVDRPLIDAWKAVGPGAESVFLGMIGDGVGDGISDSGRFEIILLHCCRHPSTILSVSVSFDHHRQTNTCNFRVVPVLYVNANTPAIHDRVGLTRVNLGARAAHHTHAAAIARNFTPRDRRRTRRHSAATMATYGEESRKRETRALQWE